MKLIDIKIAIANLEQKAIDELHAYTSASVSFTTQIKTNWPLVAVGFFAGVATTIFARLL